MKATPKDYQDDMQAAALAYMQRHQAEHLGSSQALINRAADHLECALGLERPLAEKLVLRAYGELSSADQTYRVDLDSSSAHTVALVDTRTGLTHAVPADLIARYLIATPQRKRLTSAT
ncbi:hypothetical protein RPW65_07975 [Pseudomonas sp. NyZ704]|nr:hypothetical protein RPW65_07975 [Pseudomonas sp. NyZ704]